MFETVKLPTSITNLNPSLADVDGDTLTHDESEEVIDEVVKEK